MAKQREALLDAWRVVFEAVRNGDVEAAKCVGEELAFEILPDASAELHRAVGEHFGDEAREAALAELTGDYLEFCYGEGRPKLERVAFILQIQGQEAKILKRQRERADRFGVPGIIETKPRA